MKIILSILLLACIAITPSAQCSGSKELADPQAQQAAIYLSKGDSAYEQGNYTEAIDNYTIAMKFKADLADAYFGRGRAYYFDSRSIRASDDLTTAMELGRSDADVYYYRAWARTAENGFELAVADFTAALEQSPDLLGAYYGRGWANLNIAQWSQSSILYLYQKFEADSGLATAYTGSGWKWVRQEQWDIASTPNLKNAVEQQPDTAEAFINIGFSYFKKAQWAKAIADFDAALARDASLNRGPFPKEAAVEKYARWDNVIADYDRVVEILSGQPSAGQINPLSTGNENYDLALAYYRKAKELARSQELKNKADAGLQLLEKWHKEMASYG